VDMDFTSDHPIYSRRNLNDIVKSHRGKGYATETRRAKGLKELRLPRIISRCCAPTVHPFKVWKERFTIWVELALPHEIKSTDEPLSIRYKVGTVMWKIRLQGSVVTLMRAPGPVLNGIKRIPTFVRAMVGFDRGTKKICISLNRTMA